MPPTARKGKIARLPLAVRDEVCRRLLDGQGGPKILAWLNSREDVLQVLDEHFGEEPITPQNLSEWRQGGYRDWLDRRDQIERTKELAAFAAGLADGGEGTAAGNVAIVGGQLLEIFESLDLEKQKHLLKEQPATYIELIDKLAKLEKSQADRLKGEAARDMVAIQRRRADQAESKLALERLRFERQSAELFLKWHEDRRAAEIAAGAATQDHKIEQLRELMFGPATDAEEPGHDR